MQMKILPHLLIIIQITIKMLPLNHKKFIKYLQHFKIILQFMINLEIMKVYVLFELIIYSNFSEFKIENQLIQVINQILYKYLLSMKLPILFISKLKFIMIIIYYLNYFIYYNFLLFIYFYFIYYNFLLFIYLYIIIFFYLFIFILFIIIFY